MPVAPSSRSPVPRPRAAVVAAAGLALAAWSPLQAQAVRVVAADSAGVPLAGAVADVLDGRGRVAAQGLLDAAGRRLLRLSAAGTYTVRVRRVGYEPFTSPPVTVRGAATVEVPLRVPVRRVSLAAVTVTGSRRCEAGALPTGEIAALLEQARTALTATALGRDDTTLVVEARTFARRLSADTAAYELRVDLPHRVVAARPFAGRTAAELSGAGYVRGDSSGVTFYGPDEQVLASDEFVRDHCFEVVRGRDGRPGLLGIRFVPAPRRTSEIGGTLWLDSASAELRWLDFWYEDPRVPFPATGPGRSGGQVVFERLPDGPWLVSAWRLRMPRFSSTSISRDTRPAGYEETGGVITPAGPRVEVQPALAPYLELLRPARLAGAVYDSLAGAPLAGAVVWVRPSPAPLEPVPGDADPAAAVPNVTLAVGPLADTTDAEGRYAFDSLPPGAWQLGVGHAPLDSAGVPLPRFDIRLRPGVSVDGPLAVPSRATLSAGCERPRFAKHAGLLFGTVRSAETGQPLENATVRVTWADLSAVTATSLTLPQREVLVRTDAAGRYGVCGVPPGVLVGVQAFALTSASGIVDVELGALALRGRDFAMAITAAGEVADASATLTGVVRTGDGRPLPGALVVLDAVQGGGMPVEVQTDERGRFALHTLPAGTQSGTVTFVGYGPRRFVTELRDRDSTAVEVRMDPVRTLGTVTVTDRGPLGTKPSVSIAEAMERAKRGFGRLIMGAQLEGAPQVRSVFGGLAGVRVYQVPPKPFGPTERIELPNGDSFRVRNDDPTGRLDPGTWFVLGFRATGRQCVMRVFIDGRETDANEMMTLNPTMLRAVEVYNRPHIVPNFVPRTSLYGDVDCGAVLLWTIMAP